MDCYPEYKHHHHYQYGNVHHPYYSTQLPPNDTSALRQGYNHHPQYFDGYSTRPTHQQNQHQLPSHYMHGGGGGSGSYSYEHNNEQNSQFYNYPNTHPQSSYHYDPRSHSYDSYRNASYRYNHYQQSFYPPHHPQQMQNHHHHHQQQQQQPQHPLYSHPLHHQQQQSPDPFNRYTTAASSSPRTDFPTPSPLRTNGGFLSTPFVTGSESNHNNDNKLLNNEMKHMESITAASAQNISPASSSPSNVTPPISSSSSSSTNANNNKNKNNNIYNDDDSSNSNNNNNKIDGGDTSIAKINDSLDKNTIINDSGNDQNQQVKSEELISKLSSPSTTSCSVDGSEECKNIRESETNINEKVNNDKEEGKCIFEDDKKEKEEEENSSENNTQSECGEGGEGNYKENQHLQAEASSLLPRITNNNNNHHFQHHEEVASTDCHQQQLNRGEIQNEKKILRENEKNAKSPIMNRSRITEHSNFLPSHNRCSTPSSLNYNDHQNYLYHHHQQQQQQQQPPRYHPYWHSPEYYHSWMNSQYLHNRRLPPESQYSMFASSASSMQQQQRMKKNSSNIVAERNKNNDNSSPPAKRKRKPKVVEDNVNPSNKIRGEVVKDPLKNVTRLPGFLQTFGQTEIGKFSEAFCTSSESPIPYYNNSIESDVDSPLQPWDFDSLDGPVGGPIQIGSNFYSENEFDSPLNSFSEIMCREF